MNCIGGSKSDSEMWARPAKSSGAAGPNVVVGRMTATRTPGRLAASVASNSSTPSLDAEGAALAMSGGLLATCVALTAIVRSRALGAACAASVAGAAVVLAAGAIAG